MSSFNYKRNGASLNLIVFLVTFLGLSFSSVAKTYHFVGSSFPLILEENKKGQFHGLGADITYQIAKTLGVDIKISLYPAKRAMQMMRNGDADVIIGPYKSIERSEFLDYSSFSFYKDPISFYSLKKSKFKWDGDVKSIEHLRIGAIRGWSLGDRFDSKKDDLNINYVGTITQLFTMLELKRVDLVIAHPRAVSRFYDASEVQEKYRKLLPPLIENAGFFGFSKKRGLKLFQKKFEKEYEKLNNSGAFEKQINAIKFVDGLGL